MDKTKKKRIKRYLTWAFLAGLVALLTVMPLMARNEAEADGPQASILTATAEQGSITSTIRGGGNLQDMDAMDVNIPTGVKITGFLVKNGDIVQKGTPVATVDKVSVMAAITSVTETMDYLQQQLEDGRDEKVADKITAVPGGRVKKIFAQEGEEVQEVMLRDGCLAVLSIDSMMAVQVEQSSGLSTGETANVTLADGTVVSGRVESNLDGKVVVTVEDEGYELGQTVTVEGLGSGTLYVHNAWKATAYAGTISKISVKEEQTVSSGATLFTLGDREFEGQLQHRANQHREYEQLLQRLIQMYETGTIDAPCEGIVSGVDTDSAHLLAAQEDTWEARLLDGTDAPKYRIVLLADTVDTCTEDDTCQVPGQEIHKENCPKRCTGQPDCKADKGEHKTDCLGVCKIAARPEECKAQIHESGCIYSCTIGTKNKSCGGSRHHYQNCIESCKYDPATKTCPATGDHKVDCIRSCVGAEYTGVCKPNSGGPHYEDCIESCTTTEACPASRHKDTCHYYGMTYTAYVGLVEQKGSTQIKIYKDTKTQYTVKRSGSGWEIVSPQLNMDLAIKEEWVTVSDPAKFGKNDIVLDVTGHKDGKDEHLGLVVYQKSLIGETDVGDLLNGVGGLLNGYGGFTMPDFDLSGMLGGFYGFGNFGGLDTEEAENLHDLEGTTLLTVTPHRTMKLPITIDERDIAKITPGMTAVVKVEALKNQEFLATITKVGITGANSGGSSKFTVELELIAVADMLPGMSASASVDLTTKENVIRIPVAALDEVDGKAVVYTALDEKTQEPSSPREVTTGVSDGEMVEILTGLDQDDQVYYLYYDTLELDTSAQAERFTFG